VIRDNNSDNKVMGAPTEGQSPQTTQRSWPQDLHFKHGEQCTACYIFIFIHHRPNGGNNTEK